MIRPASPKPVGQMKAVAFLVGKFAVAGKFLAALSGGPGLAGGQQLPGIPLPPAVLPDKNALQIAHGAAAGALHVVVAQLALGKACRFPLVVQQEKACVRPGQQGSKLLLKLLDAVPGP